MEKNIAQTLLTEPALKLLDEIDQGELGDELALSSKLRKNHSPELVSACITQAKLRQKAEKKFGPFAKKMLFTREGLEQASRLTVSAQRVSRYQKAGIETIVDLGCGLGGDAMAFASFGMNVTAIEVDEVTAAFAQFNSSRLGVNVVHQNAEEIDIENHSAFFADPARRRASGNKQRVSKFDYSPSLDWLIKEVASKKPTAIKLGPADDYKQFGDEFDYEWISDAGELVELTLYSNQLRGGSIRQARLLAKGEVHVFGSNSFTSEKPKVRELGKYIYEPDASLIRSGLMGEFGIENGLGLIDEKIAYLTSDEQIKSPWLRGFEILEIWPFDEKLIAKQLKARSIGILEIKKRGVDLIPEQFRKKLKLSGKGAASLIVTKRGDTRVALLGKPIH